MATELPHRYTLVVALQIGSQADMVKGMAELSKILPEHIEADEKGWKVNNINPEFVDKVKAVFKEDKVKLTEDFEINFMFYLGWVVGKRMTTLVLSHEEPEHHFNSTPWKWAGHKVAKNESSNDS
ncbi:helix-turn-helix domain-containing protein [Vibrio phage vB_VpaS_1601]|uniref:helix-turn-helix domain-containing protein n=1 Tax=Vibrio phage SHOU24 TaxID=1414739 RepID=UPI0003ED2011|nr:helix-turn-helix domain-containing protein [Vibrio phage SHOU24]AHI61220.1 helix-turn-helix domain-containing protein [Vibrio phage SHOU24]WHM52751.1 helix-turn-helix domain-containing protein [Vibrio phage vB_VpaP_1601]